MATFFDGADLGYWSSTSNRLYGALTGDVSRSGNTITLSNLRLHIWSSQTSYGSGGFTFTLEGVGNNLSLNPGGGTSDFGWFGISSVSWAVATTQTSSNVNWSTSDGASGTFVVSYPSGATPPTNPRIFDVIRYQDGFSAIVSIDSWGAGGSSSLHDYYRELSIWERGLVDQGPHTLQVARRDEIDSLSSRILTSETSYNPASTLFPIERNKMYTLTAYASNGTVNTGSIAMGDYTTLPPDPASVDFDNQVYQTYNSVLATFGFEVPADGGQYPKTIQYRYSVDEDETYTEWVNSSAVVSSASASSGTFTGVFPTDSEVLVEIRSHTNAGESGSISTSFTSLNTHLGPVFEDYDYQALGSQPITDDEHIFIQGRTGLLVDIEDIALPRDGVAVSSYVVEFDGQTYTAGYEAEPMQIMTNIFPEESGDLVLTVSAIDELGARTSVSKSVQVLPYRVPTISASYERIDDAGRVDVNLVGTYAPLKVEGVEKNVPVVSYRITSEEGVVVDWTEVEVYPSDGEFAFTLRSLPTDYSGVYLIEVRAVDAFAEAVDSVTVSALSDNRKLQAPQFDVEVWTREGAFLADITHYVIGDLNITWVLNDVESLDFEVSLDALEALKTSGVSVVDILTPYAHDVKVRRNGEYIVGCNVVEANIEIPNEGVPSLKIRSTGYLNLFKDQYISEPMAGYTYPEMAHKLLNKAQHADSLIKNPTGDIDASYWLSTTGTISQTSNAHSGLGSITCRSTQPWVVAGTQMNVPAGTPIMIDFWMVGSNCMTAVRERDLITNGSTQITIGEQMHTEGGVSPEVWQHYTFGPYTTIYENGYIIIEQDPGAGDHWIRLDDVRVYRVDDEDALNNHYVETIYSGVDDSLGGGGHNYAVSGYISEREFAYELQNVKDAVMDLVQMEDDKFDFEFTPFKVFNTYTRKGTDRLDLDLQYPGNIDSLSFSRSAADLANKVQLIGSGIGDERLETWATDRDSRVLYGTHESVRTENNVSLVDTLKSMAVGVLQDVNRVTQDLTVGIGNGKINCSNVQTGDSLPFLVGKNLGVLPQQYEEIEVRYKVVSGEPVSEAVRSFSLDDFLVAYGQDVFSEAPSYLRLVDIPVTRYSSEIVAPAVNVVAFDVDAFVAKMATRPDIDITQVSQVEVSWNVLGMVQVRFNDNTTRMVGLGDRNALLELGITVGENPENVWSVVRIFQEEITEKHLYLDDEDLQVIEGVGTYYGVELSSLEASNLVQFICEQERVMPETGVSLLESLEGWYRVKQINARISPEGKEDMSLTLKFERGFDES